jgi:hypothetical protein
MVVFGNTQVGETNAVYTNDIRWNPWSSADVFRLFFTGITAAPVVIEGEGLCSPLEIDFLGPDSPIDYADL